MKSFPKALLLDMDGVLYHGDRVLPYALEFMHSTAALPRVFLTNNPIATPAQVADRLAGMGLGRPGDGEILTSGVATARYLAERRPGFRYFCVGAQGLDAELSRFGLSDPENADFVVVGEGPGIDFTNLTQGINLILQQGAELVSTNPDDSVDATIDGRHRVLPGGGALVAPFEVATGAKAISIGKPHSLLFEMALHALDAEPGDCVMIGDRVDTDIAGAQRVGIHTALVRTGRYAPGDPWPAGQSTPDWDVPDLHSLLAAWQSDWPDHFDGDGALRG